MSCRRRHNITEHGAADGKPMLFAHGFGCDQNMWRYVWPAFAESHRVVLFDHVGAGGSDLSAYDPQRYSTLTGYLGWSNQMAPVIMGNPDRPCAEDAIAPEQVGRFVDESLADSRLVILDANGHCPNLSAPAETVRAIQASLRD